MNDPTSKELHEICSHRPPCPGCPRLGEAGFGAGAESVIFKWRERAGTYSSFHGERFGWRTRARLAVRGSSQSPKVGIFQAASHRIADIPSCPVHHPLINEASAAIRAAIRTTGIIPYHDNSHRGEMRYASLVVERATRRVAITLVTAGDSPDSIDELTPHLQAQLGSSLHSVSWNSQPKRSNAIFGPRFEHLYGNHFVKEELPHATILLPPSAFGQANPAAAEEMIEVIRQHIPKGAKVADLYAGVGPIGLSLLDVAHAVVFVESAPGGLEGLDAGIAALTREDRVRTQVQRGQVVEHLESLDHADVIIADPPRKGLDIPLIERFLASPPRQLILVHCGLDAFDRDIDRLTDDGQFGIRHLSAHDFFPHTGHVEMLTVLDARDA